MSVRLEVSAVVEASVDAAWEVLVDWAGQSRWIPLTTVKVTNDRSVGLGARVEALSGVWVSRIPVGLLDRFIVTSWSPPADRTAELEILHLGPYFTGPPSRVPRYFRCPAGGPSSGWCGSRCRSCGLVLRAPCARLGR